MTMKMTIQFRTPRAFSRSAARFVNSTGTPTNRMRNTGMNIGTGIGPFPPVNQINSPFRGRPQQSFEGAP